MLNPAFKRFQHLPELRATVPSLDTPVTVRCTPAVGPEGRISELTFQCVPQEPPAAPARGE